MSDFKNSKTPRTEQPPRTTGERARYYGVLPRYMAGGSWNPSKKRQRRNG